MNQNDRIKELENLLAERDRRIEELEGKLSSAESELVWLRKKVFGKMTEKHLPVDPNALEPSLFDEIISEEEKAELEKIIQASEAKVEKLIDVKPHTREVRKPVIKNDLPVIEEHIYPEGINTEEYSEIGTETTDTLEIQPARFHIRRIVRHKMVLKSSLQIKDPERQAFLIAPLPPMALNKSMASASLLADIIIGKYVYHLPFHRQLSQYKELGVDISSSTIGDWFAAVCEKLRPLYNQLRKEVFSKDYIQLDESTLPVIDNEKRCAARGYVWAARDAVGGSVYFFYKEGSRSAAVAMELLKGYKGAVQTDGYPVYDKLESMPGKMALGCWAHVRREFAEALDSDKKRASEALAFISRLYDIEREMKEQGLNAEQIKKRRQIESYKIVTMFENWLLDNAPKVSRGTKIYSAIQYAYKLIPRLGRYTLDGRYAIDNNAVESCIRPMAVGRKNYLFCGNDQAATRACIAYSLMSSCKAYDIEPREWLIDVLPRINSGEAISALMPSAWKSSK